MPYYKNRQPPVCVSRNVSNKVNFSNHKLGEPEFSEGGSTPIMAITINFHYHASNVQDKWNSISEIK